jgi:hypothetical protein
VQLTERIDVITTSELASKIEAETPKAILQCPQLGIDTHRYVVEGDIGLTDNRVIPYAARRIEIAKALETDENAERQGLLAIERDGKILRWRRGKRLSYCVWRPTFESDEEHAAVVEGMAAATSDWSGICGVEFQYVPIKDHDPNLTFGDVDFPVLRQLDGGNTIAMAFFPDDPIKERLVWVFDGYFNTSPGSFDPIGVMRHELGHVLGFRHEHIRPEAPDLFNPESAEHTIEISQYDPKSVMHYVAPGVGDPQLRFTDLDKTGARFIYGGIDSEFSFAD